MHLCFVIILLPSYTSLSIFNMVDTTLALTTSASKLQRDLEDPATRVNTTRSQALRQRVKESKQAQWLQRSRKGTHVFLFKLGERSRALDWYWKIWRDMDGQLPERFDISVPALSTIVRIKVPEDEYDTGGTRTQKELSAQKLIKTCWDMMSKTIDMEDLLRQKARGGGKLNLELAWKSADGALEWVAYPTTVEGQRRAWAVLAGLARLPVGRLVSY